ncbi:MAG: hypothetical protein ACLFQU_11730 [Candidatus Kapaibacterium sp.]
MPTPERAVYIRYQPSNGKLPGNFTYLKIPVTRTPPPPCPDDHCGYVCNGDFENSVSWGQFGGLNPTHKLMNDHTQGWYCYGGGVDVIYRGNDSTGPFVFPKYGWSYFSYWPESWDNDPDNNFYLGLAFSKFRFPENKGFLIEELQQEMKNSLAALKY